MFLIVLFALLAKFFPNMSVRLNSKRHSECDPLKCPHWRQMKTENADNTGWFWPNVLWPCPLFLYTMTGDTSSRQCVLLAHTLFWWHAPMGDLYSRSGVFDSNPLASSVVQIEIRKCWQLYSIPNKVGSPMAWVWVGQPTTRHANEAWLLGRYACACTLASTSLFKAICIALIQSHFADSVHHSCACYIVGLFWRVPIVWFSPGI